METLTADRFTLVTGEEKLSLYQWNTKKAKHYFCVWYLHPPSKTG